MFNLDSPVPCSKLILIASRRINGMRGKPFEGSYKPTILMPVILKSIHDIKVKEAPGESLVKQYAEPPQFKY
jgi:hypothetical protein